MKEIAESLRKFSNVVFVFANIGFVAAVVGVCLTACAMLCMTIFGTATFDLSLGNKVVLHGLLAKVDENAAYVWGSLCYWLSSCILLIPVMRLLMRLFANMRDHYTPFTIENAELFKKMAIRMIVVSIVPSVVGESVGQACAKMMNLSFAAEFGDSFSLFAVLVLFAMSMVFQYGCALQEQADTTL